jgi:transposase
MPDPATPFNRHFDEATNALVVALTAQTQNQPVRSRKNRRSCLDPYLPEIITKYNYGWTYQRIADYLKSKYGISKDKTKVWRRIKKFMEGG